MGERNMPHSPLQIAASLQRFPQPPRIVGREDELTALRAHIRARRPIFVSGPSGMGKTALLQNVYSTCGSTAEPTPLLYCGESNTRRNIIIHVLVNLLLRSGRLESRYIDRRKTIASPAELRRFIAQERLPDLSRMMHQNLDRDGVCLLLDHLDRPHPKVASLIEVWLERFPLIIVARAAEHTGRVRWLLSAFDHLELPPLTAVALRRLARDRLADANKHPLRDGEIGEAVTRCGGNPGRLIELLEAAELPRYRKSGAVQWRLIDLDLRIRAIGRGQLDGTAKPRGA